MARELTTMNVSLSAHMRASIEQRVKADGFGNISDLIRALVREDQVRRAQQELERRLRAALDGGEATPMTAADWDDIKRAVKTKIAAREGGSMILKRRQASLSLIEPACWISKESLETAARLLNAAAAPFSFLEDNPEILDVIHGARDLEALVSGSPREQIQEGLDSGPAEPLDREAVKTEARKSLSKTK